MRELDLHCNINETVFSWTLFLTRFVVGSVLLYITIGGFLYYREFLYNAAALGFPMPVPLGLSLLGGQALFALFLMLGWLTRFVSTMSVLGMGAVGVIFFAGDFNRIFIALLAFLITALLPSVLLGPGKISLDYTHAVRRANNAFRG
ncbi:MAG: hypothetical protein IKP96_03235 [Elusimicrobiaceae bacterium]|nr:hypothetical protein [Elusimicrobiaceae bacterium]